MVGRRDRIPSNVLGEGTATGKEENLMVERKDGWTGAQCDEIGILNEVTSITMKQNTKKKLMTMITNIPEVMWDIF